MPLIRDDDEERLARIEQMREALRPSQSGLLRESQEARLKAAEARLALEDAQKETRRTRAALKAERTPSPPTPSTPALRRRRKPAR